MSSLVLSFFLFVCLSIHACSARSYVGDAPSKAYHFVELPEKSTGHANEEESIGNIVKENYLNSFSSEASQVEEFSERSSDHMDVKIVGCGSEQAETKVLKVWQRRFMLTISRPQDNEEMVNSKGDEEAGADEEDYAQPHRKPPIHNQEN